MSANGLKKMPLSTAMSHLYGYIYCMLLSNALSGVPLYGGALYLCGRAVMVGSRVFSRKNRKYLPSYGKVWGIVEFFVLFTLTVLLIGLYPKAIESTDLWVLYAVVALCLFADAMTQRIYRLTGERSTSSRKLMTGALILQAVVIAAAGGIMLFHLGPREGWPLTGGFAALVLFRAYSMRQIAGEEKEHQPENQEETAEIRNIQAYRAYEWISMTLVALVELLIALVYALLAFRTEWLLPAIVIAILFTLLATEAAVLFLRRARKPNHRDPTWMLIIGLGFCAAGLVMCILMMRRQQLDYVRVYICLAISSIGGTLSLSGLIRIEQLMPDVVRFMNHSVPFDYYRYRASNQELARLLGDTLALIILTVICLVNGRGLPNDITKLAARFQPVMIVPLVLVVIGALISVLQFPLSAHYIDKLRTFLKLQETGETNPAMQKQLENVVSGQYRQPFLTRFLIMILRPLFRYKLVNEKNIQEAEGDPLLFLGNHLEVLGPMLCAFWFPVHVRFWAISLMMGDQKKVSDYVFTNTFGKVSWLPVFAQKLVSNFIGWLSVTVLAQLECIPVYRDSPMKLRETVRESIEALETGDNLMIFPESPDQKYELQGIGKLSPGFVMLATAYWKKCGKRLKMMPVYMSKEKKTIEFGHLIQYEPESAFADEQERIIRETETQIFSMAGIKPEEEEEAK